MRAAIVLTVVAALVFGAGLGVHPMGRDEAVSVLLVRHPLDQIVPLLAAHEVHPAGYFLMLWAWPHSTPVEARLLSWLPAVACIPVTLLAGHRLGLGRPWLLGLLAALSPFLAYESEEARMYTWLAFFGAVALLTVAAVPQRPGRRWGVGLGVLLAAGMYIQYFAAFTGLGLLLLLLFRRHYRTAAIAAAVAGLLFLPGLLLLLQQVPVFLRYPSQSWQERLTPHGLYSISGLLFGGSEFDPYGRGASFYLALPALYGALRAPRRVQLLLACSAGLPLLLGFLSASLSPRYLAAAVPALLYALALAAESIPKPAQLLAAAAAVALSAGLVVYTDLRYDTLKPPTPDLLAAARAANAEFVVGHDHFAPQAAYYAPGGEAFVFVQPAVDHVGLWALPPGLAFPPDPSRPVLAVSYCELPRPIPPGYVVTRTWVNAGADFCAWLAVPG
jgi:hypothetical protein